MSRLTHNMTFQKRVFPGNHLHWYLLTTQSTQEKIHQKKNKKKENT